MKSSNVNYNGKRLRYGWQKTAGDGEKHGIEHGNRPHLPILW